MPRKSGKNKNSIEVQLREFRKDFQGEIRILKQEIAYMKKHVDKIWENATTTNERLQDLEVQVNLISRLIATLAVEKMNMKTFSLIRMIKKIEKQAIVEDQIRNLERLYQLEHPKTKKPKDNSD